MDGRASSTSAALPPRAPPAQRGHEVHGREGGNLRNVRFPLDVPLCIALPRSHQELHSPALGPMILIPAAFYICTDADNCTSLAGSRCTRRGLPLGASTRTPAVPSRGPMANTLPQLRPAERLEVRNSLQPSRRKWARPFPCWP